MLEATGNRDVRVCLCDVSDLRDVRDVRAFAARFSADQSRLDVLVNNAGVLVSDRALSADGNELTLATNVLGPFLLTNLLIPLLTDSAPARVINVSSGGMYTQRLHVQDLQSTVGKFDGPTVYARTKRAQVILTELWARRLAGTGVIVHSMHPGWADTPGVASSLPRFHRLTGPLLRSAQQGADTIVWFGAAAEPGRAPAASGTTADDARRIACRGRAKRPRIASGYGASASASPAGMHARLRRPPASTRRAQCRWGTSWSTWRSAEPTSPSTSCRSSHPRIRRPGGSSTAAWRAASRPTPGAPGPSRSTPTWHGPCANSDSRH